MLRFHTSLSGVTSLCAFLNQGRSSATLWRSSTPLQFGGGLAKDTGMFLCIFAAREEAGWGAVGSQRSLTLPVAGTTSAALSPDTRCSVRCRGLLPRCPRPHVTASLSGGLHASFHSFSSHRPLTKHSSLHWRLTKWNHFSGFPNPTGVPRSSQCPEPLLATCLFPRWSATLWHCLSFTFPTAQLSLLLVLFASPMPFQLPRLPAPLLLLRPSKPSETCVTSVTEAPWTAEAITEGPGDK